MRKRRLHSLTGITFTPPQNGTVGSHGNAVATVADDQHDATPGMSVIMPADLPGGEGAWQKVRGVAQVACECVMGWWCMLCVSVW